MAENGLASSNVKPNFEQNGGCSLIGDWE